MGVQWYVVLLSSENTLVLMRSASACSSTSAIRGTFTFLQLLHHIISLQSLHSHPTLWFVCHPPPLFSIAFSQSSFSRLTAFFLRVGFSTARFLLHRKFVRLWERSVNQFTWAPTDVDIEKLLCILTDFRTTGDTNWLPHYKLNPPWIIDLAAIWSSSGRCRVFRLVTPGCFLCICPLRKSTWGCRWASALIPWGWNIKHMPL